MLELTDREIALMAKQPADFAGVMAMVEIETTVQAVRRGLANCAAAFLRFKDPVIGSRWNPVGMAQPFVPLVLWLLSAVLLLALAAFLAILIAAPDAVSAHALTSAAALTIYAMATLCIVLHGQAAARANVHNGYVPYTQ